MDVVGPTGALGVRQSLAVQSETTRVGDARQRATNTGAARATQESTAVATTPSSGVPANPQTAQRAARAVAASDTQNPNRPLPRGSLVNILV